MVTKIIFQSLLIADNMRNFYSRIDLCINYPLHGPKKVLLLPPPWSQKSQVITPSMVPKCSKKIHGPKIQNHKFPRYRLPGTSKIYCFRGFTTLNDFFYKIWTGFAGRQVHFVLFRPASPAETFFYPPWSQKIQVLSVT